MTDINRITYTLFICLFFSCQTSAQKKEIFKITKSDQQWRNELTERQYTDETDHVNLQFNDRYRKRRKRNKQNYSCYWKEYIFNE